MARIGTIRLCRRLTLLFAFYGAVIVVFISIFLLGPRTPSYPEFVLMGAVVVVLLTLVVAGFSVCVSLRCPNCGQRYLAKGTLMNRLFCGRVPWTSGPCCHCGFDAYQDSCHELLVEDQARVQEQDHPTNNKMVEQAGTGQPATRPQSKSEGSQKPKPESEGRSR